MHTPDPTPFGTHSLTPYEQGNQNQTTTWQDCIAFYVSLAQRFPHLLHFSQIGVSDAGAPLHAGVFSTDGVFSVEAIHAAGRPIFFNNNGIHPGEPEGIDACMALVRDLCFQPERQAALGQAVYLFIPVYNVDGSCNRGAASRANQEGPEAFGFRGNALHLDLNRDFIKCDSRNAQVFNQFFSRWSPDVMVDTHTSNGADYSYTMTLINTQPDKLGGDLGTFLRTTMLPAIYQGMQEKGWPTCPYVNPVQVSPDQGIADFLETPRYSTGYAALHHTLGFMPETHMLKPYKDRYESMRALVEVTLQFTLDHAQEIQALRRAAKASAGQQAQWPVRWALDESHASPLRFKGYAAVYSPSQLGHYERLSYDRSQPWERDIPHFNRFNPDVLVDAPLAYVVPQAWKSVVERLQWNGVAMERIEAPRVVQAKVSRVVAVQTRPGPYEGHMFHDEISLASERQMLTLSVGDWWVSLDQDNARYAVETLEPDAHDSFFRWGFFNSILEKKEHFSDYVFEDMAVQLLADEPALAAKFADWKEANPQLLSDQTAVLSFIFENCARFAEPQWRRYPVLSVLAD